MNHTVLYALSMSIGTTKGLKENAFAFCKAIVENKLAAEAAIWINKSSLLPSTDAESGFIEMLVSFPATEKVESFIGNELMDKLLDTGILENPDHLFPFPHQKESFRIFLLSLGNAGFIELRTNKNSKSLFSGSTSFTKADYNDISPVLDKFAKQLRWDGADFDKVLKYQHTREPRSALGNMLLKKEFQRRIVATLSHEFRNPLNILLGYLELLAASPLNNEQTEQLEIITDTSQSLYHTVKKVFQFTNLTLDQSIFNTESFNLVQLFERLEKMTAHLAIKKKIDLRFNMASNLDTFLLGDESKLSDVLVYLIDNAFKFTSSGEIVVNTKLLADTPDTVAVQFEVTDTGIGIDATHHEQVFQFFGQEDDSITRHYGGLGLGLSIANEYVTRMGGALDLRSTKGKGTGVVFNLPFLKDKNPRKTLKESHLEINENLTCDIKVLLVDDDAYQRDMGVKILKGWNLFVAENGQEAIKFLEQNLDTEVILMDIRMPVMDGISATRIIRNELKSKALIIAVSGEVQETTIEECLAAGMDCFVPKPYNKSFLIQTITGKLQRPDLVVIDTQTDYTKLIGLSALVVEDNKMIQLLTNRHMKDAGCNFDMASDGESALEFFRQNTYDFVLLDLYLPDTDGFELARIMRNSRMETCIIAYSGDDSEETKKACSEADMDGMILKNYQKTDELAMCINKLVEKRRMIVSELNRKEALLYDLDSVRSIIGDNEEDLIDILQSFVKYSSLMIQNLETFRLSDDHDGIKKTAHTLKSSARQFLMNDTADKLHRLEKDSTIMDKELVNKMIAEVIAEFSIAIDDMKNKYKI